MDATLRRERLENLYRVVKAAPSDRLDMGMFWCGTAGCALGWCAHDSYFNALDVCMVGEASVHYPDLSGLFGITFEECDRLFWPGNWKTRSDITKEAVLDSIVALIDATPKPVALPAPEAQGAAR